MPFNINNLNDGERHALGEAAAWARQSIAFAMCLRDADTKRRLDNDLGFAKLTFTEAHHLTDDLWVKAANECPDNATLPMALNVYARKVFDWCYKHMNP